MSGPSDYSTKLAVLAVALMLVGQVVGQPVLLTFVRSGSMEPTLDEGDGFVALPTAVTGPPEQGDVIIYRANQLNGGGLTTHRVVRETDRGYITRGDANPFTDQSAGEPPVRQPQVVAVAFQAGDSVVVVPHLGTLLTAVRDTGYGVVSQLGGPFSENPRQVWIALAAAGLVVLLFGGSSRDQQGRAPVAERDPGTDSGWLNSSRAMVLAAGLLVVLMATASMTMPLGPTEYRIVSAESDAPGPQVIPAGGAETTTYQVPGGGVLPTRYYVEPASEGVTVGNTSGVARPGASVNVSLTFSAPPEIGSYRRYVAEHRYPLVLPVPVVDTLYALHPVVPVVVIDALLAVPFLILARQLETQPRARKAPGATSSRRFGSNKND